MSDENNRAGTVDYSSIDISVGDSKPVERPFLGSITIDAYEEGRVYGPGDSGVTWHLEVTAPGAEKGMHSWLPLKYASQKEDGQTVYFDGHDSDYPVKYSFQGALGRVLDSIREVHGAKDQDGQDRKPGNGGLVGLTGYWVLRVQTYGKDKVTGEIRGAGGRPVLIATKKATAEDLAGVVTPSQASAAIYTAENIEIALDLLSGFKPIQFQKTVIKAAISADLKTEILGGKAALFLVANGYATLDGGVINRVAVSV